ncbi:uncharacterized protein DS421_19g651850 [Arachis hypogaea]|uniref:Uncharacterized protein n=1 Tax=Arachis hypogaea TaxID=3818 RepID=A0A6B9V8H6_ARAHY|nr:uncharacterized protein DS421_19g651850 [Arachis hypogaea]
MKVHLNYYLDNARVSIGYTLDYMFCILHFAFCILHRSIYTKLVAFYILTVNRYKFSLSIGTSSQSIYTKLI